MLFAVALVNTPGALREIVVAPVVALNVNVEGSVRDAVRVASPWKSRVSPLAIVTLAGFRFPPFGMVTFAAKAGATIKRRKTKEVKQVVNVEKADRRVVTLNFCKNTPKRAIMRAGWHANCSLSLSLSLSHFCKPPK